MTDMIEWWRNWNLFVATDICLIGIGYVLWRSRSKSPRLSRVQGATVVGAVGCVALTGASLFLRCLDWIDHVEAERQARSSTPAYQAGLWYAVSPAQGPWVTEVFKTEMECKDLLAFLQRTDFSCHVGSELS